MKLLAAAFVILIGSLVAWEFVRQEFFVIERFRYRFTITFEADGKLVSGSSVTQVIIHAPPCWPLEDNCTSFEYKGSAFPLVFPNGSTLLVLMGNANANNLGVGSLPFPFLPKTPRAEYGSNEFLGKKNPVQDQYIPTLLYFSDFQKIESLAIIDPYNMPKAFGDHVAYEGSTVEYTNDPVTIIPIKKYFPWLPAFEKLSPLKQEALIPRNLMLGFTTYFERND
ncbi:MAG TPA: hypothetical protein VE079_21525 [Ensifer sp.]|nr:hypothetical protein [Ensifer sp.]